MLSLQRITTSLLVFTAVTFAQNSPLTGILEQELNRNFTALKSKGDPPPYFMSYQVIEIERENITATAGSLQSSGGTSNKYLDVSVRVGSPELDNYHVVRGSMARFAGGIGVPLDDNPNALRQKIWLETDRVYRNSAQRLISIQSAQQTNVQKEAAVPDFSAEAPQTGFAVPAKLSFNRSTWEDRAKKWSSKFSTQTGILASQVNISAVREVKTLVNTEGTRLEHGRLFARIIVSARAKASDGMDLVATESFEAADPSRLPGDAEVEKAVEKVQKTVMALLRAPVVEPYVGPAILSGRASGVFFHEIFGHRIEGHRQKDETEGQTFAKSVGTSVLPDFLSVSFDATRKQLNKVDLNGWYDFDDEGVKASNVQLVEKGILKTFLMSRSPIEGFNQSNGHGRKQTGLEAVSRQSNLIVESSKQVSDKELRKMLIEEVKRQGKPYGLYFEQVTGGYTTTGRRGLQAFTVIPLVVYRVWADGRPDELVRGADIVGTPLASFAKIMATSDKTEIFNGYCGAESGMVPVSAASPALLVSEIEIQKKEQSQDRPPFLSRPQAGGPN